MYAAPDPMLKAYEALEHTDQYQQRLRESVSALGAVKASATPTRTFKNATVNTTIGVMQKEALKGARDLEVRNLATEITKDIPQGDYSSEMLALYYWVCQNIRYVRDPQGVEWVQSPRKTIEFRSGDCDDMATLIAAMLMALGNQAEFAVVAFGAVPVWSHVYAQVPTKQGKITLDPVANRMTEEMHGRTRHKREFPVSQGPAMNDAGIRGMGMAGVGASSQVYSVFDYNRGLYEYFQGPLKTLPATGRYRSPRGGKTKNGIVPEALATQLPLGAAKLGEGEEAKGLVATRGLPKLTDFQKGALVGMVFLTGGFWYARRQRWI